MSIFNLVKKHYSKFPSWLLKGMGMLFYTIPASIRYGKDFGKTKNELIATEYMSEEEQNRKNNELFVKIVRHAYEHVPFYRELYEANGVNIDEIHGISDISKLPIIDKTCIKERLDDFISNDVKKENLMYITTSGSTGYPVGFYQDKHMLMIEWAYTMHIWSRIGCRPDSSRLILRGKAIHPESNDSDCFWDPLRKELSCNVFNMTVSNLEKYCCAIEKYRPEFIHGYMSATVMLAKYIQTRPGGLKHQFRGILATSENVLQDQKEYVEKVLNARVFSFYGHSERLVIAGECEKSGAYHIEPLYGYAEILDEKNQPCDSGELIATGFINYAMPLIRYRTGDYATWGNGKCKCGRNHLRLAKVEGHRKGDVLVNADGAYISMTALNIHSEEFDRIVRFKFVQKEQGCVTMLVLPQKNFSNVDAVNIKRMLIQKTVGKIDFTIQVVDDIPLEKNGKFKVIEQYLKLEQ